MRKFQFDVDAAQTRKVNQTWGDMRRLQLSAAVLAIVLVAGAVIAFLADRIWTTVVAVVLAVAALSCMWVIVWVPRKMGSIGAMYANGPLVPAVVSEIHPRGVTLLALIDIAKDESNPVFALVTRNTELPKPKPRIGKRMPAVAVLDDRHRKSKSPVYEMVSPMPLWWGTSDEAVLARAEAQIPPEEWAYLTDRIGQSEEVRTSEHQRLVIEPADLPEFLRRRG
ncbi:DUF3239 domain-containing protein [Rhodococcus rhodnii]|uniref:Uncharacterized protein n=2 Tax=Rhodococcus rhodnii TaxID=38312 RepID=R7WRB8_9NOCA|nr:DUF3239 domain-containing protein [Rhodococcus rhodnii]EOM77867.1 hypothetical protein Rrhod_0760 [Rhodococcus rhodnii LMG 5362]TXG88959.1 DUF3239 domain-containing protein [Rhodococcus rhodnii]